MASASLTLGPHWEAYIRQEIESGRYGTASEVVRAGLRELEDRGRLPVIQPQGPCCFLPSEGWRH